MSGSLDGRIAIVTGTSPNIGTGIALAMAGAGAAVACLDHQSRHAEACAELLREKGATALAVTCDVSDAVSINAALDAVGGQLGSPQILVNNATRYIEKGVLDLSLDDWNAQLEVILTGSFLFTQLLARRLVAEELGGAILNVISTAGHQGQAGNVGYATAKAGLLNLTRASAMDLARHGIRVNSITPTSTDPGEMLERAERFGGVARTDGAAFDDDGLTPVLRERRKRVPMGRLPRPSDYGSAAVFLCSDEASMITGTDLRVDGGVLARYWGWLEEES